MPIMMTNLHKSGNYKSLFCIDHIVLLENLAYNNTENVSLWLAVNK